jgi:hypothetical protein
MAGFVTPRKADCRDDSEGDMVGHLRAQSKLTNTWMATPNAAQVECGDTESSHHTFENGCFSR